MTSHKRLSAVSHLVRVEMKTSAGTFGEARPARVGPVRARLRLRMIRVSGQAYWGSFSCTDNWISALKPRAEWKPRLADDQRGPGGPTAVPSGLRHVISELHRHFKVWQLELLKELIYKHPSPSLYDDCSTSRQHLSFLQKGVSKLLHAWAKTVKIKLPSHKLF